MILSDITINERLRNGDLTIDPLSSDAIQPSSVDLRLASEFLVFANHEATIIDIRTNQSSLSRPVIIAEDTPFILHPREFVLGATVESVGLPRDLVGRIEGRSSLGRLGLMVHSTAGFVDAGWTGQLTLELFNVATLPITLIPGMRIAQITFLEMTTPAGRPYGAPELHSKYQGQTGPTPSRSYMDFSGSP